MVGRGVATRPSRPLRSFSRFYALLVGRGVATRSSELRREQSRFYALLVGRGVATGPDPAGHHHRPLVSMPCWSGEGLRPRDGEPHQPRPFLCPVGRARGCDVGCRGRAVPLSAVSMPCWSGEGLRRVGSSWPLGFSPSCFYALLVGRGVATISGITSGGGGAVVSMPCWSGEGLRRRLDRVALRGMDVSMPCWSGEGLRRVGVFGVCDLR